jgi:hypothetical protein
MRCPQCRKWIDIEALSHSCGWRVGAGGVAVAQPEAVEAVRATRDEVQQHLAKMRGLIGARPVAVSEEPKAALMSDVEIRAERLRKMFEVSDERT